MKKLIAILLAIFMLFTLFQGALRENVVKGNTNGYEQGFAITLAVPDPQITKVDGKDEISVEGFVSPGNPGQPILPKMVYRLIIPPNAEDAIVEILDYKKKDLEGKYDVRLGPPITDGYRIYTTSNAKEDQLIENMGVSNDGNITFISIKFSPFIYDKESKKLSYYKTLKVKISYEPKKTSLLSVNKPVPINKQDLEKYYNKDEATLLNYTITESPSSTHLLIIVPSSLQNLNELNLFKQFKESEGYNVVIETTDDIYSTQSGFDNVEKIRNYLKSKYSEWENEHFYLLLIGAPYNNGINQTNSSTGGTIPMRYCYPDPTNKKDGISSSTYNPLADGRVPTDYYYANLSGIWDTDNDGWFGEYGEDVAVDFVPDIYVGRIPFDDPLIVQLILAKSMKFEQRMTDKKSVLFAGAISNFTREDRNKDTLTFVPKTDGALVIKAMQKDFLEDNGYSVTTLYETEGKDASEYKPDYALTESNFVNQIRTNIFGIVAWRGHGWMDGVYRKVWADDKNNDNITQKSELENPWPAFVTSTDAKWLSTLNTSIYFSSSCITSMPDWKEGPSLTMELLKSKATAIVGATRLSLYEYGWDEPSDGYNATLEYYFIKNLSEGKTCSESLYNALLYHAAYFNNSCGDWQEVFDFASLYGDPTLKLENTGTVNVNATLNGSPWEGPVNYTISGPEQINGTIVPFTSNRTPGTYTLTYNNGGPDGATFASVTPDPTQTLTSSGSITFTINFTTPTSYTGNIEVNATLDGASWNGPVNFTITGPTNISGNSVPSNYSNKPVGKYTLQYNSGGPDNAFLSKVSLSPVQNLGKDQTIYFTLEFETNLPNITLTSPVGGEIYSTTDPITITWTSQNLTRGSISLFYSSDGFQSLNPITTLPITETSYTWTDHNFQSNNCYIVVANFDGTELITFDYNKWTPFTISDYRMHLTYPQGGETFTTGDQLTITWTSQNLTKGSIWLFYSTDGFKSLNRITETGLPLSATSYTWTVPSVDSNDCYIVVANFEGTELLAFDFNLNPFDVNFNNQSIWAMFRYNTQHTGQCPYNTSNNNGTLKWKFEAGSPGASSPAIAGDGTVYVGSRDHYLYAINPDGTLKWKFETGAWVDSSPAIASDGTIYVGSGDDYLYAIKPDGTLKWKYQTGDWGFSSPAIASDGTIYVGSGDDYLYAIKPDGTLKWKYQTGDWIDSSPAIAGDGTVYVGSDDNYLYAINPDGTLKWKFETGWSIFSSPAIASDGTIYVGSGDYYLYAINPDGTLKWKFQTGKYVDSSPAIASDGTIYVGSDDYYLYAIKPDGTLKWKYQTGDWGFSSPAIASDGTIYVGSGDDYLYAIKPDGTLKWKYQTGYWIASSPAIASDGTIYVGSGDSYLYAIGGGIVSPDFSISTLPSSRTVTPGSSTTYTVTLTSLNGFNNSVSLSISSVLPSGVTATFNPSSLTPTGSSTLTISTSTSTPANSYTITITASGGGVTHTTQVTLNVTSIAPPSPPQNLKATFSESSIKLEWDLSQPGTYPIANYAIYRGTFSGGESQIAIGGGPSTMVYTDTNVTLGTTYYYYVKAFDNQNPSNYSDPSNEVSITFKRLPVLLVHGFQRNAPFDPEDGWKEMAKILSGSDSGVNIKDLENSDYSYNLWYFPAKNPGYPAVYVSDYSHDDDRPTTSSISDYALSLKAEIDYIKNKREHCSKVDIVAHSMGGLVTRRYIESADFGIDYYSQDNDVNNLIMIGTPNLGAPAAALASYFGLSSLLGYECGEEMAINSNSNFLPTLNGGVTGEGEGVHYFTIAGEVPVVCLHNETNCLLPIPTDTVVTLGEVRLPLPVRNYTVMFADHSGLINEEKVADAVKDILSGNPPTNDIIFTGHFNPTGKIHFQLGILQIDFLCPVNITIKDQYGRMINSQGVNQIPDASVQVIDDEKLFCLPSDLTYTIESDAYSQGSFTLETLYLNDSGIIPATAFENVAINSNTKVVSSTIQPNSVDFVLNVDSDGNGTFDYQKTPDLSGEILRTPSPPQNLSASISNSSVTLNWTASTQGTYPIAGYAIYKGTSSGGESSTPIATVPSNTTTYTDTDIILGITYYYYVKAFDNQNPPNYSEASNEVSTNINTRKSLSFITI